MWSAVRVHCPCLLKFKLQAMMFLTTDSRSTERLVSGYAAALIQFHLLRRSCRAAAEGLGQLEQLACRPCRSQEQLVQVHDDMGMARSQHACIAHWVAETCCRLSAAAVHAVTRYVMTTPVMHRLAESRTMKGPPAARR